MEGSGLGNSLRLKEAYVFKNNLFIKIVFKNNLFIKIQSLYIFTRRKKYPHRERKGFLGDRLR